MSVEMNEYFIPYGRERPAMVEVELRAQIDEEGANVKPAPRRAAAWLGFDCFDCRSRSKFLQ
jgi:hypothetical protein